MSESDLLQNVEQARMQLTALLGRLEQEVTAQDSLGIRSALGDLQKMLEVLHTNSGLLREILAHTSDAIFVKGLDGRYVMINPIGALMFGKEVREIIGQDDTALFARESAERIMAIDRVIMETGQPHTFEEVHDLRGVQVTLITTETAWYEPKGTLRGLIGSVQDVTERKQTERAAEVYQKRLRSLASEIAVAEERLRHSLATDLHDGLGQDIALAKMKLAALRNSSDAALHEPLIQIEHFVDQADRSLRSITSQLGPPSLYDLGLVEALQWLAEDIRDEFALDVRIDDDQGPAVTDDRMRVTLFRAVRELLVNTARHAGASGARVRLGAGGGLIRISVEDDGEGFDTATGELVGHGLFGIREQLGHLGGSMSIVSAPGRGTTVVLTAAPGPGGAGAASTS